MRRSRIAARINGDSHPAKDDLQQDADTARNGSVRTIDDTLREVMAFLDQRAEPVPFDDLLHFMTSRRLSFGPGVSTIDLLEVEAYRTGKFDIDRDERLIYQADISEPSLPTTNPAHTYSS